MKKFLCAISAALLLAACSEPYDDSAIQNRMNDIDARLKIVEATCTNLNSTIVGIAEAMEAVKANYTVQSVTETEAGYIIRFTNSQSVLISNGADGKQGAKGDKGDQGEVGPSPVVGVAKVGDIYYWTVNGELLKDADGKYISASAGAAVAPRFKVEADKWYVSTDGGKTWEVVEGASVAPSITVTEDAQNVYLALSDGTKITLPKTSGFAVRVEKTKDVPVKLGGTLVLKYSVSNADADTRVFAEASGVEASLDETSYSEGTITVTVPETLTGREYVIVKAVKNSTSEYSAQVVTFSVKEDAVLTVATTAYEVPAAGGQVDVLLSTNVDVYDVTIPDEAGTWVTLAPATKAVRQETVTFNIAMNAAPEARTASVVISAAEVDPVTVTFVQAGAKTEPDQIGPNLDESMCVDVMTNGTVQWNCKTGKNASWSVINAVSPHEASSIRYVGSEASYTSKDENTSGVQMKYAYALKWVSPQSLAEGDAVVFTVPVKEVAAGTTLTFDLPFNISGTGPVYYNIEVCYDGANWEKATVSSISYISSEAWNTSSSAEGLSYTTLLEKKPANVKFFLKGVAHMITSSYVIPKKVVCSEIKVRFAAVDVFDQMNYETDLAAGNEPEIPTTSCPTMCFASFIDVASPGVAKYNGPAITFAR